MSFHGGLLKYAYTHTYTYVYTLYVYTYIHVQIICVYIYTCTTMFFLVIHIAMLPCPLQNTHKKTHKPTDSGILGLGLLKPRILSQPSECWGTRGEARNAAKEPRKLLFWGVGTISALQFWHSNIRCVGSLLAFRASHCEGRRLSSRL